MARTPDEVIVGIQRDIEAIDPGADATKGPIYDWVVRPNSRLISEVEERQDRTDRLASADFTAVATDEELERMAGSVGAGLPQGAPATVQVFFGTFSRPKAGTIIQIPQGSVVGSLDGTLLYQTTQAGQIDGDFPEVYLNPARRTYEVAVPVQSAAVGSRYNLPPRRIRNKISTIAGIDFVENRVRARDGKDPGTTADLIVRAQSQFQGQELGSVGGLESAIVAAFQENVLSVSVITSADAFIFRRLTDRPGLDVYYSGTVEGEVEENFVAIGGELTIEFANQPVLEVTSLLINGVTTSFELVEDDEPATFGSILDTTHILLSSALSPGDAIVLRYDYDALASQISLSFDGSSGLFSTDTLIRRRIEQNPKVVLKAKASSGFNPFTLRTNMENTVIKFFETNLYGAVYLPSVFEDYLQDNVIGLASRPGVSLFQLEERALLDIEPIELRRNENIVVSLDLIDMDIT